MVGELLKRYFIAAYMERASYDRWHLAWAGVFFSFSFPTFLISFGFLSKPVLSVLQHNIIACAFFFLPFSCFFLSSFPLSHSIVSWIDGIHTFIGGVTFTLVCSFVHFCFLQSVSLSLSLSLCGSRFMHHGYIYIYMLHLERSSLYFPASSSTWSGWGGVPSYTILLYYTIRLALGIAVLFSFSFSFSFLVRKRWPSGRKHAGGALVYDGGEAPSSAR